MLQFLFQFFFHPLVNVKTLSVLANRLLLAVTGQQLEISAEICTALLQRFLHGPRHP
jgi:hypothetical protein